MSESEAGFSIKTNSVERSDLINLTAMKTLGELAEYYYSLVPEDGIDGFKTKYFFRMRKDPEVNGDLLKDQILDLVHRKTPADHRFSAMLIACAYCADASRLLEHGEREQAWEAMSEARYWCALTLANRGAEPAWAAAGTAARKATSQKAAQARASKHVDPTKEEAFRLARELRPPGKGWQSRRQAMVAIRDRVIEFSGKEKRKKLSKDSAEVTIYRWLAKMPDADLLFPKKV